MTPTAQAVVNRGRFGCNQIVRGLDDRLLCVVGPCSVHDVAAAKEYATKLAPIARELEKDIHVVMRVYFEKPRTTIGWKGLINDPMLDDSYQINKGLRMARALLIDINEAGLPCAGEFLETITPQHLTDLISWGAVGARTTESQIHRQLASGLSVAIGFKNSTAGDVQIVVDAIRAASFPHSFLGVTKQGLGAIVTTKGNDCCHTILRGGTEPNYEKRFIDAAADKLEKGKVRPAIMIDCSHGNSNKDYRNQPKVCENVCAQVAAGDERIIGVMIESNIHAGKQDLPKDLRQLRYGVSITDGCVSFEETIPMLHALAAAVQARRKTHHARTSSNAGLSDEHSPSHKKIKV